MLELRVNTELDVLRNDVDSGEYENRESLRRGPGMFVVVEILLGWQEFGRKREACVTVCKHIEDAN